MPFTAPTWLEPVSVAVGTLVVLGGIPFAVFKARSRKRAVDAEVSADAHAIRLVIRGWILAAEHLQALGGAVGRMGIEGEYEGVEHRLERAVVRAPHASRRVANAIRDANRLYQRAVNPPAPDNLAGFLNQGLADRHEAGLHDLRACEASLTQAIDPEFRGN